jgi:hypothetical protein
MKACQGSGGIAPPLLTSILDADERSVWRPVHFTPGWRTLSAHWIGCWVRPRSGLDAVLKNIPWPCWESTLAVQLVAIPTELSRLNKFIHWHGWTFVTSVWFAGRWPTTQGAILLLITCSMRLMMKSIQLFDRLCGLVVRDSGYRSREPGFYSRRYQIFLRRSGFGTGSTQPREDKWGATWMEK